MLIREARVGDAIAIADLLASLDYLGTDGFIAAKVCQHLSHPEALLWVAEDNAKILGFISLHFIPQLALAGDFCRVSYFCVAEEARGLGLGTKLLERAEMAARARGCDRMEVHCHSRREFAHQFYFQRGYEESPKYLLKMLSTQQKSNF